AWRCESQYQLQERRLACPVLAQDTDHISWLDAERHVIQDPLAAESFSEPLCGDVWCHCSSPIFAARLLRLRTLTTRAGVPRAATDQGAARVAAAVSLAESAPEYDWQLSLAF